MSVKNKKFLALIIAFGFACLPLTACSLIGNDAQKNFGKGEEVAPYRPQHLQKDKLHSLRESAPFAHPTNQNKKAVGAEWTVKTATLFKNPQEAGISMDEVLTDNETHYDLQTGEPSGVDLSKSSFLLCDITIKNISSEYMNITDLSLVYLPERDKELKLVGLPAYFFKPKEVEDSTDYYNFKLPVDKTVDTKVGWWVNLEECKKENLYLMFSYGGDSEYQQFWNLNLQGGE